MKLYLTAGLFNIAERHRNARLAKLLELKGWEVVLPQRLVREFLGTGIINLREAAIACLRAAADKDNLCVVCLDGPDGDSLAAMVFGAAGRAIAYRSDIRTTPGNETGTRAYIGFPDTLFVSLPCFAVEEEEIDAYYETLAQAIHKAALRLEGCSLRKQ